MTFLCDVLFFINFLIKKGDNTQYTISSLVQIKTQRLTNQQISRFSKRFKILEIKYNWFRSKISKTGLVRGT